MALIRLYTGNLEEIFRDRATGGALPVSHIAVYESENYSDGYTEIDVLPVAPSRDYIETLNASDSYFYRWYQLHYIRISTDSSGEVQRSVLAVSDPVFPESVADLVDRIRERVGDTSVEYPAFSDEEYIDMIRFANRQWRGDVNLSNVKSVDYEPVTLLVLEQLCVKIAMDHAKYFALATPTVKVDKSQIQENYIRQAELIRSQLHAYAKRLNMGSGGYDDAGIINQMPRAKMVSLRRFDRIRKIYTDDMNSYDVFRNFFTRMRAPGN